MTMRPKFHFTAQKGWLNDPNGLVYYRGEYHLFFQYNPNGKVWSRKDMHWEHAVSSDLLHWQELPPALFPKGDDVCYSGSAIVDWNNVSGLQTGNEPPLLAFFTSTGRGECLVFSNDGGRTFSEYPGNPVIRHRGRDPRILYHEESSRWILAVYDEVNHIAFYASEDLKHWHFQSRLHGFYECPELFKLQDKWVIFGADGRYQIGDFDGHAFEPQTLPRPLFTGDAYAAQTFSNADRRILIAWMRSNSGLYADLPFCQQMTLPCELTLDGDALRIDPAVDVPREIISSPDRETVVEGIAIPPAEHIEIVRDTMSVEIFVNHGKNYFVKALPPR